MDRREFPLLIEVNGRQITKLIIDPHYELKHASSVSDDIILNLVRLLDGGTFPIQERNGDYEYFVTDQLNLNGKLYKLV